MIIVIMGVCGSGKSTVGKQLARELKMIFHEGDDLHSEASVNKMSRGEPLTELEREPWLKSVREVIDNHLEKGSEAVITCSALSQKSRQILGTNRNEVRLLYLHAPQPVLMERLSGRENHFMPPNLLESQLETLEEPHASEALFVRVDEPLSGIITQIIRNLKS